MSIKPLGIDDDVISRHHSCAHDGTWSIEKIQDLAPYLKNNKRMYNDNQMSSMRTKDRALGRHKASIPMIIFEQWQKEYRDYRNSKRPIPLSDEGWKKYLKAKLRDPDNRFFRVDGGRD